MWAIPFASRSTLAGPSSPGTSTGSAAAPRASRPAGRSRDRVRTTMMARRIEATSPGTGSQLPEHWLPQASSEPGEAYQSGPITSPGGGAGYTHGAMTRLRVPGWPWSVVAAVVVVVLVGGGLFALGGEGGSGDRPGAVGGGGSGDAGTTPAAPVRLTVTPKDRATRVALDATARVVAEEGRLRAVRVTGAGGREL